MNAPIITFLSDFGLDDWFVGVVHGVLNDICPQAHVVDLIHTIAPGDFERASFVLEAAAPDFARGAIHLAVVDPGVGTARRALAVRAHGQVFVGPDNGLLEWAFTDPSAEVRALEDPSAFRHPLSRTFHGRDVFAPVAAHIACGVPLEGLGPLVQDPVRGRWGANRIVGETIEGRVRYVDRFGNALTSIDVATLARAFPHADELRLDVEVCGRHIRGAARSYGDAAIGTLVALIGSSGRLEIAEVGGHAASRFGLGIGDRVTVRLET